MKKENAYFCEYCGADGNTFYKARCTGEIPMAEFNYNGHVAILRNPFKIKKISTKNK